jgi:hypothetical protein
MATRDHPTSVRLPPALKAFLKKAAQDRHYKLSMMIVYILEQWRDHMMGKK